MATVRLHVLCRDGFCYHGWQRIECHMMYQLNGVWQNINVSRAVAELWNARVEALAVDGMNDVELVQGSNDCFFMLSGESFTLGDVKTILEDTLFGNSFEITTQDGELEEGSEDFMIRLPDFKETGKHFRCSCGGNVFRKRSDGKYVCNSCRNTYSTNKEDAIDAEDSNT